MLFPFGRAWGEFEIRNWIFNCFHILSLIKYGNKSNFMAKLIINSKLKYLKMLDDSKLVGAL